MKLERAFKKYFGYDTFRKGQKEVIELLMAGNDVLAMLPTGTGKSICFQLPALMAEGVTIVVSPLLSLMEDQVQQLKSEGIKRVVALNSFMSWSMRQQTIRRLHTYKIIYISPEMLQVKEVQARLQSLHIAYFVIDEAHCISQWGHDFRPDYLRLNEIKALLHHPPCLAITATATEQVQHDICNKLSLQRVKKIVYSIDRPTISYHVKMCHSAAEKMNTLVELVHSLQGPGLIYFSSRMQTEKCAALLKENGIDRSAFYHGGLVTEERLLIQQQFMNDQLDVICCTSAFGMGINKKDIRYIIHYHYPTNIEAYVQEVGRAARDGKQSVAILLYNKNDRHIARSLTEDRTFLHWLYPLLQKIRTCTNWEEVEKRCTTFDESYVRKVRYHLEQRNGIENDDIVPFSVDAMYEDIKKEEESHFTFKQNKLEAMEQWIHSTKCRRQSLLSYFSETLKTRPDLCCDRCGATLQSFITENKKKEDAPLHHWQKRLSLLCKGHT